MKFSSLNKIEKSCIVGILIAFLIIIVGAIFLITDKNGKNGSNTSEIDEDTGNSEELADEMIYYPSSIQINEPVQDYTLYDANGISSRISDYRGKNVILLFWTSWCKYCKEEFKYMPEYAKLLESYDDVEIILINKFDGIKETKEQALTFLNENKIPFPSFFDENLMIYNSLGIKIVPTMIGIDSEGILKVCKPGQIGTVDNLKAFIDYVKFGGAADTEKFITNEMTTVEGGVHVNYLESEQPSPAGFDILSESQGIMMEYGVLKKDKALFDQYLNYVTKNMLVSDSLAAWMVTKEGSAADSNALVDDLRMYKALYRANQLWGGYDELLNNWGKSIIEYNTNKNQPVNYYDFKAKKKANRISLCFLDFEALKLLEKIDTNVVGIYDNSNQLMKEGYISNDFPFYYSYYDYDKKEYSSDDLNMAEAMYTLLNLARVNELGENSITWIEKSLESTGIKARYTINGDIVEGYNYESTAIYAIVAMIGKEIGNNKMVTEALSRMELVRTFDSSLLWKGTFTTDDGKDIFSFDQCMALLLYGYLEY
ncbi:MAG: glycoside hydrolase [Herbinix sp.]|jgi:peroxiredoxin/endo-1,4-beta-D-glucanase Y|nr:glycoside hydrolase [Herbinix sp.]